MRPPQPPTSIEDSPSTVVIVGEICAIWSSKAKGASFCQVDRIRPVTKSRPCSTSGSQKCTGASPNLRARAKVAIDAETGKVSC